jgi:ESCRT-II complex subunit VPS36
MNFWTPSELTVSGAIQLLTDEVVYLSKEGSLRDSQGRVILTSHRLVFVAAAAGAPVAGSLGAVLGARVREAPRTLFSRSLARSLVVELAPPHSTCEVAFNQTSDAEEFSASLKLSLGRKGWQPNDALASRRAATGGRRHMGVSGILKQHERGKTEGWATVNESFKDLDALMAKAKSVVSIMEKYQGVMKEQDLDGASEDAEGEQMRALLMTIGIRSPVTKASAGSQAYHQALARELADFLTRGAVLERAGGVVQLADCYALFNRARGLELVSPDDLATCARLLKPLRLGIALRTFASGVEVLQADSHGDVAMGKHIGMLAEKHGTLTTFHLSTLLLIPLALAREHVSRAEKHGYLARDESMGELVFYPNRFTAIHAEIFNESESADQ